MLLKRKKDAFVLAIIGLFIVVLYALLLTVDIYFHHLDFLKDISLFGWIFTARDFNKFSLIILFVLGIIYLFKPSRATSILVLIFSVPTFNAFIIISSILFLIEIKKDNNTKKEPEEKKEEDIPSFNLDIECVKEEPINVCFSKSEVKMIIGAIVISSIYLVGYSVFLFFAYKKFFPVSFDFLNFNKFIDSLGPAAMALVLWLILWLILVLLIFLFILTAIVISLIPFEIIIANLVVSIIALKKGTVKSVKVMRVFGIIGLTFLNHFAARNALKRLY